MRTNSSILGMLSRKFSMALLLAVSTIGAFATLGDGKARNTNPSKKSLLSIRTNYKPGYFSLTPGYKLRGSQVINTEPRESTYVNLNSAITYQSGHTSYIVPLKKKMVLNDKVVFNPNAATRH